MYEFNRKAFEAHQYGVERGIVSDSESEIISIILEQEIVSYCTSKGCVSFDYNDLQEV